MTKKEIDEFLYKVMEVKLADGTKTAGKLVPNGNGYLLLTIYGDYPYVLEASDIKSARYHTKNFIEPDEEDWL